SNQALFPAVASNAWNQFFISWQDHRNSDSSWGKFDYRPQIYHGVWDLKDDIIWSSGQGHYDTKLMAFGFKPRILTDPVQNFYIAAHLDTGINVYKCPLGSSVSLSKCTSLLTDSRFFNIDNTSRSFDQWLRARVYDDDAR